MNFRVVIRQKSVDRSMSCRKRPIGLYTVLWRLLKRIPTQEPVAIRRDSNLRKVSMYTDSISEEAIPHYIPLIGKTVVQVHEVMTIDQAHKKYGRM